MLKMNFNNENYEIDCEYCGQPFAAERISRRYCSDSCRQLAYLKRKAKKLGKLSNENEIIPQNISESNDLIQEVPKEDPKKHESRETNLFITETRNETIKKTRRRLRRNRQNILSGKDNSIQLDGRIVLFGAAVAGLLIHDLCKNPKTINKTNHPGVQESGSVSFPDSYLTIHENRIKSEKDEAQTIIQNSESEEFGKS